VTQIHNEIVRKHREQSVGKINIKQAIEHTFADYECAAWSQSVISATGIFDLYLVEDYLSPHAIYLKAKLPTTITSDYFPALWCGMPVSEKPYDTKRNAGREGRPYYKRIEILDAVARTGNTPDAKDFDIFVPKEIWREFIDHYRGKLAEDVKYARECTAIWQEHGDGNEFRTQLTQMGYACGEVRKLTKIIDELERRLDYLEGSNSQMWMRLYRENNVWAQDRLGT
jgi:hypothetical protein